MLSGISWGSVFALLLITGLLWVLVRTVVGGVRRDIRERRKQQVLVKYRGISNARNMRVSTGGAGTIKFVYVDSKGVHTEREIIPRHVDDNGLITGYCLLRRAVRQFYAARIEGPIMETATGELLEPDAWAERWCLEH